MIVLSPSNVGSSQHLETVLHSWPSIGVPLACCRNAWLFGKLTIVGKHTRFLPTLLWCANGALDVLEGIVGT